MSVFRETAFDLVFNASLEIGLFAIAASVLARVIAKAQAKHQYFFYLAALLLCVAAPVVNTLWQSQPTAIAGESRRQVPVAGQQHGRGFLGWRGGSEARAAGPEVQGWIVGVWGLLVLYRLVQFGRGIYRVRRLRRDASVLSRSVMGMAGHGVAFLESGAIDDPVTIGVIHPAILFPSRILPDLDEQDLAAIVAHEYGHIRRKDFAVNILCQMVSLPVFWHPGIRYLMSKMSQTRELACDEYAAGCFGKRRLYASTLLRLASVCLHGPRRNAVELGIFDGDNLEARIMTLTERRPSLTRAALIGLVLATGILFSASALLARATSLQAESVSTNTAEGFAGTWHWMFNGKSFATMVLVRDGTGFKGSVTPSQIALDDDGGLLRADPTEDSAPKPIARASLEGSELHVTVEDGDSPFEFSVTLKDGTRAEIHPKGAPPKMKPIPAEKVR